ncbi:hypothetical protein NZD89_28010 (plasmid) [Alicyclobacillus fastidiosus]|uniref:Uncharacterized protein n=1 Tax=Alicyclobacillus fastidiosus TaxID=392011 RepID=A0ABY6ZPI1_9BACL|nr:hypothetical protein [Alicyclobacillus fastidiosus]WAH44895.1 hypothetical protein NZD89_28010 [Alicyclobacillus fastidiosus]GMA65654.1 hypothetical protein GCM10025859_60940 [Alicyclobacillus fastidiosus]
MNGVAAGIIGGILLLVAAVVGVSANNSWSGGQQGAVQNYTSSQITTSESQTGQ